MELIPSRSNSPVKKLRVRHLVVAPGRVYSPGELVITAGRVAAVGPYRGRVRGIAIVPGLVNAHAHLQLPRLPRPVRAFLPWVNAVMARRAAMSEPQLEAVARAGVQALLATGCTAAGEVDSTGLSPQVFRTTGMAGRCYRELTGYHLGSAGARQLLLSLDQPATRSAPSGLAPHAPYSVSGALFRAALRTGRPLAVHCAETPEEVEFTRTGRGPFRELLERLGRLPTGFRAPLVGPVEWLLRLGLLGSRTTLIHCQEVCPQDIDRLVASPSPIVVCPGTIRYFGRSAPDVPDWLRRGLTVGLGTDSMASNQHFSMLQEMASARRLWPDLSAGQVFAMATAGGARALCRPGLGSLRPGVPASFAQVEVRAGENAGAWLEAFTWGKRRVLETRLCGRSVEHKPRSA